MMKKTMKVDPSELESRHLILHSEMSFGKKFQSGKCNVVEAISENRMLILN
jgi:hypothetical protein